MGNNAKIPNILHTQGYNKAAKLAVFERLIRLKFSKIKGLYIKMNNQINTLIEIMICNYSNSCTLIKER